MDFVLPNETPQKTCRVGSDVDNRVLNMKCKHLKCCSNSFFTNHCKKCDFYYWKLGVVSQLIYKINKLISY